MAKKTRSRKQKAATRKLIRFNKAKGKKKSSSRRKPRSKAKTTRKKRKVNKTRKTKTRVAGKGKGKKIIDKIPVLKNKTVQRIGFGLGMGVIAVGIIDLAARFAPPALVAPLVQNKQIIKLGTELVTEPLSAVADVLLSGGIGSLKLPSLTGSSQQAMAVQSIGNGFA